MKKLGIIMFLLAFFAIPSFAATTKNYGDQTLTGGFQSGNFPEEWDLTQCPMTLSFTYDGNGLVDDPGTHAWSEIGVRAFGYGNFNPTWMNEGAGIWLATDYDWTANTFDPDVSPTLDLDDKFLLQKGGGMGESAYDLPSTPPVPGNNHRFWWDRDGVDPWQNDETANTGGIYDISITLAASSPTTGTAYMNIRGLDQGFETDENWNTIELTPAGMSFSGDMTKQQVFYGLYCYGATHSVAFNDIQVNGCYADTDSDGVVNHLDRCPDTPIEEEWESDRGWGTNRWQVQDDFWYQNKPVKKGGNIPEKGNGIDYTYGCNGHQILNLLTAELGDNAMSGHYKFGLSSSVLEEFHLDMADGKLDGMYLLDTVIVPTNTMAGATSTIPLVSGVNYRLDVSGEWTNRGWEKVDAKFTSGDNWVTQLEGPSGGFLNELLDLQVNEAFVDWGLYSDAHEYSLDFPGDDGTVNFRVFDGIGSPDPAWYGDNVGSLTVKIYADL